MHKLILMTLFIMAMFPSVLGLQYRNICNNEYTLNKFMNFTACENVTCINYNFSQVVQCEFGCDNVTQSCRSSSITEYGYYFISIIAIIVIFGVIYALYKRF